MKPYRVIICLNRFDMEDTWAVRYGFRWLVGHFVSIQIPVSTVFKGPKARQPRAYLQGFGVARQRPNGVIFVTAH